MEALGWKMAFVFGGLRRVGVDGGWRVPAVGLETI